jgi:RND family efflux transporter MFP subunit
MRQILTASLLLVTLAIVGCGSSHDQLSAANAGTPKNVSVAKVVKFAGGASDEIMGSVVARNTAQVTSKVPARVDRILADIGSRVSKGQVLAELDAREFQAKVQQARAMQEQASQDLDRFQKLLAQSAATQQEFDGVKARAAVTKAALDEAEAYMSFTRIIAPFSGVVTSKTIDVGDMAFPGQPTFTIEEAGSARFVVTIPESYRPRISAGQEVTISIPVIDTAVTAKVEEISPSSDPMSRTFSVKLSLPESARIRPGQFGRLLLPTEGGDVTLAVPRAAWVHRGQLDLVYVVTPDKRAMLRLVRIGRQFPDKLEILSGLREDETVVISDQRDLLDGDPVQEVS